MHTVLGTPQDNGMEPHVELRKLTEDLLGVAEDLFTDKNIITDGNQANLNENAMVLVILRNIAELVRKNNFEFNSFRDFFEDLAIVKIVMDSDIIEYGFGLGNIKAVSEELEKLFLDIKIGFIGSPERLIMEEERRADEEMMERQSKETSIDKAKKEIKRYSIGLVSLFGLILDSVDLQGELVNSLKTENLVENLASNGLEINRNNLMRLLEERVLELMLLVESQTRDSHIFKNHGDNLNIEEMNKLLEAKGRNRNRNRNFQSKFDSNIFIARAIVNNIFDINEAITKLKERFLLRLDGNVDHRGRPNLVSDVSTVFARFKEDIGTVYQTDTYDDGTCVVNEGSASKTQTVFIGLKMFNVLQTVDGHISSGIKFSIETMYPVNIS